MLTISFGNQGLGQVYTPQEARQRLLNFGTTLMQRALEHPAGPGAKLTCEGEIDPEFLEPDWQARKMLVSVADDIEFSRALERLKYDLEQHAGIGYEIPTGLDLCAGYTVVEVTNAIVGYIKIYDNAVGKTKFPIGGLVIGILGVGLIVGGAVYFVRRKRTPTGGRRGRA